VPLYLRGPPQQTCTPAVGFPAGQLLVAGTLSVQRRRRRAIVTVRTMLHAAIDKMGRRWETPVSWIGPPTPTSAADGVAARWRAGLGALRVACHDVHAITTLSWQRETLCFGTIAGLVRAVDLESGSVVGEYYLGSHMPAAAISALRYDGATLAAGDARGRVHVWRARLPGSWGFSHSPDWVLSGPEEGEATQVHKAAITALEVVGAGGALASSDSAGVVALWQPLGTARRVAPFHAVDLGAAVQALCADPEHGEGVFAGLANGDLYWLGSDSAGKASSRKLLSRDGDGITALAWDTVTQAVLMGFQDGHVRRWRPGSDDDPEDFARFHHAAVRHIALTMPPAEPAGCACKTLHMVSTGADGRVGVWDIDTKEPLWGLQGLSPSHLVALGDQTRLVCNGVVINIGMDSRRRTFSQSWKDPRPDKFGAPTCEAVLCFDLLPEYMGGAKPKGEGEHFWPSRAEKYANCQ